MAARSPQPKAAAPAPSQPVPVAKPAATKTTAPGPINKGDFISKATWKRVHGRMLAAKGDYLSVAGEEPSKPMRRIKYRPFAAASVKVSVGLKPWDEIKRLAHNAAAEHEVGGAMLGHVFADVIYVMQALPPAAGAVMEPHGIRHHIDRNAIAEITAESTSGLELIGAWHSHPTADGEPSRGDMASIADMRDVMGIANPVELIVTPTAGSWSQPAPHAWVLVGSDDRAFDYDVRVADLTGPLT